MLVIKMTKRFTLLSLVLSSVLWAQSGGGTVNGGSSGQFAYYFSDGTAVGGHTLTPGDIPALNYLGDSGTNGPLKRTSPNTTAPALYSDIVALFNSGSCSGYLKSDGTCATSASSSSSSGNFAVGSPSVPSYISLFTADAGSQALVLTPHEPAAKQVDLVVEGFSNPGDATRLNQVMRFGWNINGGGGLLDGSTPGLSDEWESHWCPGAGDTHCYMERHIAFVDTSSHIRRPLTIQMDKTNPATINSGLMFSNLNFNATDNTQRLQVTLPSGTGLATMNMIGQFRISFNTNNFVAIQQQNAAGNAYIPLIWADNSNLVQVGGGNASGINLGAPLQQTVFANNRGLLWKDSSGAGRLVLNLDNGNNLSFGNAAGGQLQINAAAGKQIRFENNNFTSYIASMFENTQNTAFGSNIDRNYKVAIEKSGSAGTLYVKDETALTGSTRVLFDIGAADTNSTTIFTLNGLMKFAGLNATGSGTALLGANSPALNTSSPYTWIAVTTADGSKAYIPAWK